MRVTFFMNYLNNHQVHVADEMSRREGVEFRFVATAPVNASELKGGRDFSDRPYYLNAAEDNAARAEAERLVRESDVCVFGAGTLNWEAMRAGAGEKLSFEISERWFKRGALNLLSPRLLKWWWVYQTKLRSKPFYKLCASAFTAGDCRKLGAYKGRCYKWGYFTTPPELDKDGAFACKERDGRVRILWTARFISLKHPESMVDLCRRLLDAGYRDFEIDMIGDGPELAGLRQLVESCGVSEYVHLRGSMPNERVLAEMRRHDIFCFTSDRNEGWGAVLNEAMSCGCCVISNGEIGATGYLIEDGVTGLIYNAKVSDSLFERVRGVMDDRDAMRRMAEAGYESITRVWSARQAVTNLLQLIDALSGKGERVPQEGPASIDKR